MYIYKVVNNINGKIYIGKTSRDIPTRWREHCSKAKNKDSYFHYALNYYGIDNFTIEKLDTAESEEELNSLEQYWISFYKSNIKDNGYNLTSGGDGNLKYDWSIIREMWDNGFSVKEITNHFNCDRHTVSDALKNYKDYSLSASLSRSSYRKRGVNQYSLDRKFLNHYDSIKDASISVGCSEEGLSRCLSKHNYAMVEFLWTYDDEELPQKIERKTKKGTVKVAQLRLDGSLVQEFESSASAARSIRPEGNVNSVSSTILQVCNGRRKTAYGYKWIKI